MEQPGYTARRVVNARWTHLFKNKINRARLAISQGMRIDMLRSDMLPDPCFLRNGGRRGKSQERRKWRHSEHECSHEKRDQGQAPSFRNAHATGSVVSELVSGALSEHCQRSIGCLPSCMRKNNQSNLVRLTRLSACALGCSRQMCNHCEEVLFL